MKNDGDFVSSVIRCHVKTSLTRQEWSGFESFERLPAQKNAVSPVGSERVFDHVVGLSTWRSLWGRHSAAIQIRLNRPPGEDFDVGAGLRGDENSPSAEARVNHCFKAAGQFTTRVITVAGAPASYATMNR